LAKEGRKFNFLIWVWITGITMAAMIIAVGCEFTPFRRNGMRSLRHSAAPTVGPRIFRFGGTGHLSAIRVALKDPSPTLHELARKIL